MSTNEGCQIDNIRSKYVLKFIFSFIGKAKELEIIIHNKNLKKNGS